MSTEPILTVPNLTGQGGETSLCKRRAENVEVWGGGVLLVDLFFFFFTIFCPLVIKYLKGFSSQFPLGSCAFPYY